MDPRFAALLACPGCGGALHQREQRLRCADCPADYPIRDDIPDLRLDSDARTAAVRSFYSDAPFPSYPPRDSLSALRARARRSELAQLLDAALPGDARILDLGCGTGQMSLFLCSAGRTVIGADLTRPSLQLATAAAQRYGLRSALFVETDLRAPGLRRGAFDLVFCSGVLHHTPDPRASFRALPALLRPGGALVLGLYNRYARLPHRLRRGLSRLTGLSPALLDPVLRERRAEPERSRAWLRDQYLHPEEHRHTVAEVRRWFDEAGLQWLRTYPSAMLAADAPAPDELFAPAEDHWPFEALLAQLGWARTLGREGGLFLSIGRRPEP